MANTKRGLEGLIDAGRTCSGQPSFLSQLSQAERLDLVREDHDLYLVVGAFEAYSPYAYLVDFERSSDGLRRLAARFLSDRRDYSQVQLRDLTDYVVCALNGFLRLRELRGETRSTPAAVEAKFRMLLKINHAAKGGRTEDGEAASRELESLVSRLSPDSAWRWGSRAQQVALEEFRAACARGV